MHAEPLGARAELLQTNEEFHTLAHNLEREVD